MILLGLMLKLGIQIGLGLIRGIPRYFRLLQIPLLLAG